MNAPTSLQGRVGERLVFEVTIIHCRVVKRRKTTHYNVAAHDRKGRELRWTSANRYRESYGYTVRGTVTHAGEHSDDGGLHYCSTARIGRVVEVLNDYERQTA